MTPGKSDETDSSLCGATNRNGEPCQLPAGWGTPGSGGNRCRFHGGCSSGPDDTSHLEDNDFAEGDPGGGAPPLNTNASIHEGFSDWRKAYERFDEDTREWVDRLAAEIRETAAEYAPDVDPERRDRLAREQATMSVLKRRAAADVWCDPDGSGPGRGLVLTANIEIDGETYIHTRKINPAWRARTALWNRDREIAKELRLWPGFRGDD